MDKHTNINDGDQDNSDIKEKQRTRYMNLVCQMFYYLNL